MSDQNYTPNDGFENTNWHSLRAAAQGGEHAHYAREEICYNYRQPLYFYIRRKGHSPEDAEDLIQEFLFKFIFTADFASLDQARGTFRSYLLACVNNFLAKNHRKNTAQKRGGGGVVFSSNTDDDETQYINRIPHNETPEVLFDRKWAETVLERAWSKMESEFQRGDKTALFRELKAIVEGDSGDASQAETASRLGMTPAAFRKALERFQEKYHAEVRLTVANEELADQETRFIKKALKS